MSLKSDFNSGYTHRPEKLSKEIRAEINSYKGLSDERKFDGACTILSKVKLWENEQLKALGATPRTKENLEWKGISNQVGYAKRLVSENLNVSVKSDQHQKSYTVHNAQIKKSAMISWWSGKVIKYNA